MYELLNGFGLQAWTKVSSVSLPLGALGDAKCTWANQAATKLNTPVGNFVGLTGVFMLAFFIVGVIIWCFPFKAAKVIGGTMVAGAVAFTLFELIGVDIVRSVFTTCTGGANA